MKALLSYETPRTNKFKRFKEINKFWPTILLSISILCFASQTTWAGPSELPNAKDFPSATSVEGATNKAPSLDDHFAKIDFLMSLSPSVLDFRPSLPGRQLSIDPSANRLSGGSIQILSTEFSLRVMAIDAGALGSTFFARLPFRSLAYTQAPTQLSDEGRIQSQGSEWGGYEAGATVTLFHRLNIEASLADRQSTRLRLFESAQWATLRVSFENRESKERGISLGMRVGGGYQLPLHEPSDFTHFGPISMADARFYTDANFGSDLHIRLGAEGLFRRSHSYEVGGIAEGGGGLASVSPFLQYELLDQFWIGLRADLPLFRPVGREYVFGDVGLAGLLGKQFSFNLSATAF